MNTATLSYSSFPNPLNIEQSTIFPQPPQSAIWWIEAMFAIFYFGVAFMTTASLKSQLKTGRGNLHTWPTIIVGIVLVLFSAVVSWVYTYQTFGIGPTKINTSAGLIILAWRILTLSWGSKTPQKTLIAYRPLRSLHTRSENNPRREAV